MWDRKEVKAYGKLRFKANYFYSVVSAFLISVLAGGSSVLSGIFRGDTDDLDSDYDGIVNITPDGSMSTDEAIATGVIVAAVLGIMLIVFAIIFVIKILVMNPLQVGCYGFFRDNATGINSELGVIGSGFSNYGHNVATMLLKDIFLMLWTLLFIVPGIIKAYSYRMVPFILRDHPEMTASEVITESRRLMDGQKWNVFVFDLSYIGWWLLSILTLGILNIFWTNPYLQNANAAIYLKLIGEEEYKLEEVVPRTAELPPLSE
ncbi:MAG: DUF975 family protein [Bacillota bacterium]